MSGSGSEFDGFVTTEIVKRGLLVVVEYNDVGCSNVRTLLESENHLIHTTS